MVLAAIALLAACRAEVVAPGTPQAQFRADDPPRFTDWSEPVNLGPVVNSERTDIEVSVSRDGLSLYLASDREGGLGGFDIWVSRRASLDDPWGLPQNLGSTINTEFREQAPSLTVDGHRMTFFSDRPGGFGRNDLYVTRRRDRRDDFGWGPPVNLGGGVNTSFNESLSAHFDDVLFFNSNRPGGMGGTDIYVSMPDRDGIFGSGMPVPELSSALQDGGMAIRSDGLEMILTSTRDGGYGSFDLWVATRPTTADPWSAPVNLGPVVNTPGDESRVALSFDATTLYFVSDRPGGSGNLDIWVTTRRKLTGPN